MSLPPSTKPIKRTHPFSLRLSDQEREFLHRAAGPSQSVANYVRRQLFGDEAGHRRPSRRMPRKSIDKALLAQALGRLGQSAVSDSLKRLADAAEVGALEVTPELAAELRTSCESIQAMRHDLAAALGLRASLEDNGERRGP